MAPILVCIVGAECTGKTTLAQTLAGHFSALWVPEVLREFCDTHGRTPRMDEQLHILQAQLVREEEALVKARREAITHVFCDTCPLLTALYSDYYFSDPSLLEPAHALHTRYALTLLLAPDLPWVADGAQRDGVAVQGAIHTRLLHEFQALRFPYVGVSGQGSHRVQTAVAAVNSLTG
jgi:nicotinamide riboside kinase